MNSQAAFEEQYDMGAESNQRRFADFDAGWKAAQAEGEAAYARGYADATKSIAAVQIRSHG